MAIALVAFLESGGVPNRTGEIKKIDFLIFSFRKSIFALPMVRKAFRQVSIKPDVFPAFYVFITSLPAS